MAEIHVDDGSGSSKAKKRKISSGCGNNSEEVESKPTPLGQFKVFSDPIHGPIEMHPLMVKIIDTPQFQRLRGIKQLGGAYYVYPGASHNRFEHSLGVAHLAGQLVEALRRNQPDLGIDDKDVLCVKIAGLCHDLGHGPFSHLFDGKFIPYVPGPNKKWKHEQGSVDMFQHLIDTNDLMKYFAMEKLNSVDIDFIKEQIRGPALDSPWPYKGRVKAKSFLYEIVANKRNGMDVDKWDYFARDCHHLGIGSTFDHRRYMAFARVLKVEKEDQALWPGTKQICAREKDASNLYDMFYVRKILHQRAYQHKTGNAVELMVRDILVLANDHIIITGSEEKKSISGCIKDMTAYTKLNDSILDIIKADPRPELAAARELIHRLECRRLYKYIGQTSPIEMGSPSYRRSGAEKMAEEILTHTRKEGERHFKPEDVLVHVVTFDYGSREGNPVDKMRFYSKANPYHAFKLKEAHVSKMLPSRFSEKFVRLYCKKEASSQLEYEALRRGFQAWCEVKSLVVEVDGDFPSTPYTSSSQRKAEQPDKPNSGRNTVAKALFK